MPFLEGYVTGLALIVLIGPVLFVLLTSTFERGKFHGFAVALGIFVSDVIAVLLCTFGVARYLEDPRARPWLAFGGGLLLLAFGVRYLFAPRVELPESSELDGVSLLSHFARGFLVNFVNPFVFMVWIGIIGAATIRHGYDLDLAGFMTGAVLGVLTLDSLKVLFAHRLRPLLKPPVLKVVFRVSGVLLIGFAIRLLVEGFRSWSV
ncbi:MAG: LysE family transporter [bacterium]